MEGAPLSETSGDRISGFIWIASGLALVHMTLAILMFEPILFPGEDNAAYLILGDALRSGQGYRDLNLPGSPLHAKYPPLFPGLLAVTGALGGVQASKTAMLLLTSLAVLMTAGLGRRIVGDRPALMAAGVLALSPTLIEYGHYVLSEAPFVLFVVASLWGWHRGEARGNTIALAAGLCAFATRSAGFTVLLALCFGWALRRQWRAVAISGAVTLLAVFGWAAYQGRVAPHQASYLQELLLIDPYTPAAGSLDFPGLMVRIATNLWAYVSLIIPDMTVETDGSIGGPAMVVGVLLAALALAGWAQRARRSLGASEIFAVLYGGLIMVWPDVWTDRRFLLPMFPLLLLLIFGYVCRAPRENIDAISDREGDEEGGEGLRARRRSRAMLNTIWRIAPVALLVFLTVPSALWIIKEAPTRVQCVADYRDGRGCDLPEYGSFYDAARWAKENTPPDAVIVNRKPRIFYWFSKRQGGLYPYSSDPDAVLSAMERMGADYAVVDQLSATTARYLVPAIRAHQSRFEPVYQSGEPPTYIFRLHPAATNAQ